MRPPRIGSASLLAVLCTTVIAACGDGGGTPLGDTCEQNDDCGSGQCREGNCYDPSDPCHYFCLRSVTLCADETIASCEHSCETGGKINDAAVNCIQAARTCEATPECWGMFLTPP